MARYLEMNSSFSYIPYAQYSEWVGFCLLYPTLTSSTSGLSHCNITVKGFPNCLSCVLRTYLDSAQPHKPLSEIGTNMADRERSSDEACVDRITLI